MKNETFLEYMENCKKRMMEAAQFFKEIADSENEKSEELTWNELERSRLQEDINKLECPYDSVKIKHFKDWD